MSVQITITIEEDVAIVKIVGQLGLEELLDANKRLARNGRFICTRRLWDLRESFINFSATEIQTIAEFGDQADQRKAKVVLLVSSDLSFGLSRMFQAFRKSPFTEVAVHRDESEAMRWLLSDEMEERS